MHGGAVATQPNTPNFQQSREDLDAAYRQYQLELRRFFERHSRDAVAADDLMQTLYLHLLKNRINEDVQEPQSYLFRMAWNVLHSANRRARSERGRAVSYDTQSLEALVERSNRLWMADDSDSALQKDEFEQVLRQLPHVCQLALLRQYGDNRSYKEIAEELGVTVHTVKKYIMRALNHFRMHFNSIKR